MCLFLPKALRNGWKNAFGTARTSRNGTGRPFLLLAAKRGSELLSLARVRLAPVPRSQPARASVTSRGIFSFRLGRSRTSDRRRRNSRRTGSEALAVSTRTATTARRTHATQPGGLTYVCLRMPTVVCNAAGRLPLAASQLPRLATGRVAVTDGYSHRMFC